MNLRALLNTESLQGPLLWSVLFSLPHSFSVTFSSKDWGAYVKGLILWLLNQLCGFEGMYVLDHYPTARSNHKPLVAFWQPDLTFKISWYFMKTVIQ